MTLRQKAEKRVEAKIRFQEKLYKYIIVNSAIAIISFVFLHSYELLMAVMFFWGISLTCDFLKAYPFDNFINREKMIEKEISKMGD
ncbi:MAG: 2TM domain-containing protein [Methanobrevibacter sp.]|uniref:2TM domain-containing protein n=1 Tax=Methanobrevibacter sp. TaxID=66852 RepID=UPI0025FDAD0B|nr:2TM domain-containing protein [Methanobrevibacter sp.]MBQ8016559.1 2TM domain-containing protein [Methanobrevibacter sp.]